MNWVEKVSARRAGMRTLVQYPQVARYAAMALLLLLFAQLTTSAVVKSLTFDEPFHASFGYVTLATGDRRMQQNDEHPPLVSLLTGLAFWPLPNRPDPRQLPAWSDVPFDDLKLIWELLHGFRHSLEVLFFPPRVVVMGFALLLGAVLFHWASERHGSGGGLLALLVYTFSPNVLAHGQLATTDLPFACCFFLAVYTYQTLMVQPTLRRLIMAGLALGLALSTKVSALLLLPTFALLTLLRSSRPGASLPRRFTLSEWARWLAFYMGWLTLTGLIAFSVLWMLYGFEVGPWSAGWPALPMPTYVKSALTVYTHGGHPAFLMGQISCYGWPEYFPIALILKTPLPVLIGTLTGTVWVLWRRRWWALVTGILPPAIIFAVALFSSLNIGYRHILPVEPFLALMIAALADPPWRRRSLAVLVGGGMALWLIIGTVRIHPDYLAYFNELAGGPSGGRWYLTDSNLDWGQDLIRLRNYLRDHAIDEVYLSYFGHPDPAEYGIHYVPLSQSFPWREEVSDFAPFFPASGFYALSVTNLSGQYLENPDALDWFNHQTPLASIGHSINIYRVLPDESPPMWIVQCITPTIPLDDAAIAEGFDRTDLRRVDFDCTMAWLYPGGVAKGVYAFDHALLSEGGPRLFSSRWRDPVPLDSFMNRHLTEARLSYEQHHRPPSPFALYERTSVSPSLPQPSAVRAAPADTSPAALTDTPSFTTPVSLDGPFAFLGALAYPDGAALEVETWWQVTEAPIVRPLSIMAHLLTPAGEVLGVADGLGVLPPALMVGDVVVQRHRFATPAGDTPVWLRTGVYWLDTMERWKVSAAQEADAVFLSPTAVE